MKTLFLYCILLTFSASVYGQLDFKIYVDGGAKKLPYDSYTQDVLKKKLEDRMQFDLG